MKILNITVPVDSYGNMIYPPGFTNINCLEHLYYDDEDTGVCHLLVLIRDQDLIEIRDMTNVEEVTEADAGVIAAKYNPRKEMITDEAKIRRLEIKSRLGSLTADELKALDPDDPAPGINYSLNFIDRLQKRKNQGCI
jgi:hypothetical protein